MKNLIVFDLDGTLAVSKGAIDAEMATRLRGLLSVVKVAIISGGDWPQFEAQVLHLLPADANLTNLSILPTSGTKFFRFDTGWTKLYSEDLTEDQRKKIKNALTEAFDESGFKPQQTWGPLIDDRLSQITYSALGQNAPIEEKSKWDPDFSKRQKVKTLLDQKIPEFSVRLGGTTSIDITKPGIDKAYGIRKLRGVLGVPLEEMLFVGDALFPGGNDYPAEQAGVLSIKVANPNESKRVIEAVIAAQGTASSRWW